MMTSHSVFEYPKAHIVLFDNEDVITTSTVTGDDIFTGPEDKNEPETGYTPGTVPGFDLDNEW